MLQRLWSKWSTIAWSIREAHPRYADHNCFSEVIFGLRFLGQTWKKASWGSARQWEPPSARLTRNTWLASGPPNEKIRSSIKTRQSYTVQLRRLPEC